MLTGDAEFGAPKLDRANGYHLGACRRASAQGHHVVLDLFDRHGRTYVGPRPYHREEPGLARLVKNEGGVVHSEVLAEGLDFGGLECDSVHGFVSEDDPRRLIWASRLECSRLVGLCRHGLDLGATSRRRDRDCDYAAQDCSPEGCLAVHQKAPAGLAAIGSCSSSAGGEASSA